MRLRVHDAGDLQVLLLSLILLRLVRLRRASSRSDAAGFGRPGAVCWLGSTAVVFSLL